MKNSKVTMKDRLISTFTVGLILALATQANASEFKIIKNKVYACATTEKWNIRNVRTNAIVSKLDPGECIEVTDLNYTNMSLTVKSIKHDNVMLIPSRSEWIKAKQALEATMDDC